MHIAIQRVNQYPVDGVVCFVNTYPVDKTIYRRDSAIHTLNNPGQLSVLSRGFFQVTVLGHKNCASKQNVMFSVHTSVNVQGGFRKKKSAGAKLQYHGLLFYPS